MAGAPKDSSTPTSTQIDTEKRAHHEHAERLEDFGGESSLPAPPNLSEEEERRLYHKIDVRSTTLRIALADLPSAATRFA